MNNRDNMSIILRIVNHPLGMGVGTGMEGARVGNGGSVRMAGLLGFRPLLWIGAAIGAAGGVASGIIGGIAAGKAARRAERRQRAQEAAEEAWYNRRYNEDYLDTAAGQNLVRRAKDFARESWQKASGAQAVAGGTAASSQMAKDAGNRMVGDTIANIAASDQQRKSHVDDLHRQAEGQFAQMDMQRDLQKAQNITNAAAAASNAMMSMGAAADQMSGQNVPNLAGGDNKGSTVSLDTGRAIGAGEERLRQLNASMPWMQ